LRVMRDESADLQTRADMAKSAAPYIHPRLQAVEHAGWDGGRFHARTAQTAADAERQCCPAR